MKLAAIIQARMGSKRLPGKVMKKINNKYLIEYLIDNLKNLEELDQIIIATSKSPKDKKIVDLCKSKKIIFHRGSVKNVAERICDTAKKNNIDAFVRISADSPLLLNSIIKEGIKIFKKNNCDIVTNTYQRSYPKGQSVEIIKTNTIIKKINKIHNKYDKEHVTSYFYKNYRKFKIINFSNSINLNSINLSIDTHSDFKIVKFIVSYLNKNKLKHSLGNYIKTYKKYE